MPSGRIFEKRSFFIYLKSSDRLIRISPTLVSWVFFLVFCVERRHCHHHHRHHLRCRGGGSASAGGSGPNNFLTRGFPREFPVRFRTKSLRHLHSLRVVCWAVYLFIISYTVLLAAQIPTYCFLLVISFFFLLQSRI